MDEDDINPKAEAHYFAWEPVPSGAENKPREDGFFVYFPPNTEDDDERSEGHFTGSWDYLYDAVLFLENEVSAPDARIVVVKGDWMRDAENQESVNDPDYVIPELPDHLAYAPPNVAESIVCRLIESI